jgi:hypothetical protein
MLVSSVLSYFHVEACLLMTSEAGTLLTELNVIYVITTVLRLQAVG